MTVNGKNINVSSYSCHGKTYKNLTGLVEKVYENSVMISDVKGIPNSILASLNYRIIVSKRSISVYELEVKEKDEESLLKDKKLVQNDKELAKLDKYKDDIKSYVKKGYTLSEIVDIYDGKLTKERINRILKRFRLTTLPELKFRTTNCSTLVVTYYRSKSSASKALNANSLRLIKLTDHPVLLNIRGDDYIVEFGNWSPHSIKVSDSTKIDYNKSN